MEKLEAHAALPEHLVQRRENRLAHPGLHLPDGTALVREAEAKRVIHGEPGAHVGVLGEDEPVERVDERRVYGALGGPVLAQPGAEVEVVDRRPVVGRQHDVVAQHSHARRHAKVEQDEEMAQLGMSIEYRAECRLEPVAKALEEPGQGSVHEVGTPGRILAHRFGERMGDVDER